MKKSLLFLSLSLALPTPFLFTQKQAIEVHAAASGYKASSLPTTIDLNPVSEADVRSYYSALNGKSLNGENLLKALKPILKNGQQYYSYDNGKAIWQMYEITDRDWTLSPASSITYGTYDAEKNIITNYQYGTGEKDAKNNPYLHLLYRNHDEEASRIRAWDHHGDNKGIDREHIWPKSRGFGKDGTEEVKVPGARGDIQHLWSGDSYVNSSSHSNNAYGFVDLSKVTDNAGEEYKIDGKTVVGGNYRGKPLNHTASGKEEVFEPQDCDKGDIARACFYMVARYNNLAGDDDTIDAGNPNLFLEDTLDTATIYSTPTKAVSIGNLSDLLAWHKLDPVDDYEIKRNDLVYRNYGKNRNPFIDFPNWVDAIWGEVELGSDKRTITNRKNSPTGVASPSSDPIYSSDSPLVSIELQDACTTYFVQQDMVFDGKVIGKAEDGSTKDVTSRCTFSGFDFSKEGNTTITITCGEISTTLNVTVAQPSSIELGADYTKEIKQGSTYQFDGKVYGKLGDIKHEVTKQCVIDPVDTKSAGEKTVKLTHTPSGLKLDFLLTVKEDLSPLGVSWPIFYAIIAGAALLLLLIFIIILANSKKARKVVKKQIKSNIKKSARNSSSARKTRK